MKILQQQPTEAVPDQVIEVTTIGALVFFAIVMVFIGYVKYRDRNGKAKKAAKRSPRRDRKK